ncbi:protein DOWNSTREAM OF FLC-like [Andrographis paniculata]|uniref:protein DOWNSTREAM OF FLC-like n=1 Tax=Andrographis paniculata TaxID=175694 RepID=UPI0021E89DE7|nr:protein DOWNSTREAM OF FLC-like [Andrographis paniculata]
MERMVIAAVVLFAACVVPSVAVEVPLLLKGRVYCDTCRCGFETPASKPIAGAIVRVECRDRTTSEVTFFKHGTTDATGNYRMLVYGDRGNELCDAVLEESPDANCNKASPGRGRARVVLTRNNGISSNTRFANAMGFDRVAPLTDCPQILLQYREEDS